MSGKLLKEMTFKLNPEGWVQGERMIVERWGGEGEIELKGGKRE